jgi:hypothetical protein
MTGNSSRYLFIVMLALLTAALLLSSVAMIASSRSGPWSLVLSGLLAAFVLFALLRTEVEPLIGALRALEVALPILAFTLTTTFMGETTGTRAFDEVGAQVLIVLLLALAIDARFFRLSAERDRLDVAAICFTMLLLAVGEFYALRGLLSDAPGHAEMIAGAIAAGFTAVAVTAMTGSGQASQ